jgi:hypothetical protein
MDDLPIGANKNLPSHTKILKNGVNKVVSCDGGEVTNVESDVGLYCGTCPVCGQYFVYLFRTNSWILEEEFDNQAKEFKGELL